MMESEGNMTREEAIRCLSIHSSTNGSGLYTDKQHYEAKQMAIQALSQEPCTDAVSRDEAINTAIDAVDDWDGGTNLRRTEIIINAMKQLPSVTPKSETVTEFADRCRECGKMRKGHWIYDETIENWRCSKCNETPKTMGYVGTADFMAEHFKFCNHCGRKMVESQEGEDKE
jgi:hypothetical protein